MLSLSLYLSLPFPHCSWTMHVHGSQCVREMRGFWSRCGLVFSRRVLGLALECTLMARAWGACNWQGIFSIHPFSQPVSSCTQGLQGYKEAYFFTLQHVNARRPCSLLFDKCVSVQCYHLTDKIPTPLPSTDESSQGFIYYLNIFSIRMHLLFLY